MGEFAHLKDPNIDFIDRNRERILALIEKLFSDKVLGRKEWDIADMDSYIALIKQSLNGDIKYTKVIKFERASALDEGYSEGLYISGNQGKVYCYLDNNDMSIAVSILFGKHDRNTKTRYVIEKEALEKQKRDQAELEKSQQFQRARNKFGHLLNKNTFQRVLATVTRLDWKHTADQLLSNLYLSRTFASVKMEI